MHSRPSHEGRAKMTVTASETDALLAVALSIRCETR